MWREVQPYRVQMSRAPTTVEGESLDDEGEIVTIEVEEESEEDKDVEAE